MFCLVLSWHTKNVATHYMDTIVDLRNLCTKQNENSEKYQAETHCWIKSLIMKIMQVLKVGLITLATLYVLY